MTSQDLTAFSKYNVLPHDSRFVDIKYAGRPTYRTTKLLLCGRTFYLESIFLHSIL